MSGLSREGNLGQSTCFVVCVFHFISSSLRVSGFFLGAEAGGHAWDARLLSVFFVLGARIRDF